MDFLPYRAIRRDDKWVLQKRYLIFFWQDVSVKNILINGKDHCDLLPTLIDTLGYGKKGLLSIFKKNNVIEFKQKP